MQVCYTEESLGLRRWAWCAQKRREGDVLFVQNPVAQSRIELDLRKKGVRETVVALTCGVPSEALCALLDAAGQNGRDVYAYLMRSGLIE